MSAPEALVPTVPDTPEWHEQRRRGIGGSDAPIILGRSRFQSPYGLWRIKVGEAEPDAGSVSSEAAYWGTALQPVLLNELENRLRADDDLLYIREAPATLRSIDRPWQIANLDGLIYREDISGAVYGAEIKTVGLPGARHWDGEDGIAETAILQCAHYMMVTGLETFYLGCLIAGQRFVVRRLDRDEVLERIILEAEEKFWECVQTRTPPEMDASAATTKALHKAYPRSVPASTYELGENARRLLRRREYLTSMIKGFTDERNLIDNGIKAILGDHEVGTIGGEPAVRWTSYERHDLDRAALREEYPEIAEKFTRSSLPRRYTVLDLKGDD